MGTNSRWGHYSFSDQVLSEETGIPKGRWGGKWAFVCLSRDQEARRNGAGKSESGESWYR